MQAFNEYLFLLQMSAVTLIACVFLFNASADFFAIDRAEPEPGGGPAATGLRHRGRIADASRHMIFGIGIFLVTAYTPFLPALIATAFKPGLFDLHLLTMYTITVTAVTILAACWVLLLAIVQRFINARNRAAGAH